MVNERSDWIERLQNQVDIQKAAEQIEALIDLFGGLVFEVALQLTVQYEIILKDKQLRQIKAWYETKKGDGTISAESEEVLKEILNKGKILKKLLDKKS